MIPKWHDHIPMVILNLTPDSFSDGGQFNDSKVCRERMESLAKQGVDFFDFGAESTAPFNSAISFEEELRRFNESFFSWFEFFDWEGRTLSIDTYRSDTFTAVYNRVKKSFPQCQMIWNDVSGVIDSALFETLERCPDVDYVYCHTLTTKREETQNHMDKIIDAKIFSIVQENFSIAQETFQKFGLSSRIIFDPCFGFSKSLEQNYELIVGMGELMSYFPKQQRWLLGISRKSFLKQMALEQMNLRQQIEYLQSSIISRWLNDLQDHRVIYRLHDPSVFAMAVAATKLFDQA